MGSRRDQVTETIDVGTFRVGADGAIAFRLDRQQWRNGKEYGPVMSDRGVLRPHENLAEYHPKLRAAARAAWAGLLMDKK